MKNRYRFFLFLTFLTISPMALQAMDSEDKTYTSHKTPNSSSQEDGSTLAKEILENGYFVHLAPFNLAAEDFVLRSGAFTPRTDTSTGITLYLPETKAFRPCLYFSLNCAVDDHENADNLSARNFAVLIPTSYLLDKVVNFYPADTAVWIKELDLKAIPGCIVFARQGSLKPKKNYGQIEVKLFKSKVSIQNTVNNFIAEKTGHSVKLIDAPQGQESIYDQALCGALDLSNPEVFNFFLENKPYLSFGHEACPKKTGIGPWLKFYHTFVDDFLRMWKQGGYALGGIAEPKVMKKYQVAPYVAFAESGLSEMERLLAGMGDIETDFLKVQKPKINEAIANFKNYIQLNQSKSGFQNRLIDHDLAFRAIYSPHGVFTTLIENPALSTDKEELHVLYWLWRYIFKFHGAIPLEEKDELAELEDAGRALQKKMMEQGYSWSYARFLNSAFGALTTGPKTAEFSAYTCKVLEKVAFLLPKSGSMEVKCTNAAFSPDFKAILKERAITIPQEIWDGGVNLPAFSSNRPVEDSY